MSNLSTTYEAADLEAVAKLFDSRAKYASELSENLSITQKQAERHRGERDAWEQAASILRRTKLGPEVKS